MGRFSQQTEWLSMVDVSGPFLAVSVLEKVFPQGLDATESFKRKRSRSAYDEWCEAIDEADPRSDDYHREWIRLVLTEILEFDDSVMQVCEGEFTKSFGYKSPDSSKVFYPDFVLGSGNGEKPFLLLSIQPPGTDLEKVKLGDDWPASIVERMTLLCRNAGVKLGLVTNGERWMLVNAPVGSTSGNASWYARLWFQEPVTLQAFQSLMNVRRWFGPEDETLPAMLEESLEHHEEVTDTLGEQVRRAVEVLVQCLDRADQDRNRELLRDVSPSELYEAGLTVMMRLVFVLCAEERGLLLLGDPTYDQHYAVSTIRAQLAEEADHHGPEVLERRHDAWSRLLSVFRAVYGGIEHETLRMPALGGSLFDPDRFPFLEGRDKATNWQERAAKPLPIDNRTVLLLLNALQVLEQRGGALLLSYKALDVEQIGHVYEGLLEHTVERLPQVTLGLIGSKKAKNPNLPLAEMEAALINGEKAFANLVKESSLRSLTAIKNALKKDVNDETVAKVITVCGGNMELANRIYPFANLLRADAWGDFIVYQANSFAVTLGADRRETGTHYTPKSLTESIVETTLEPVAYVGPAEGTPREQWQLKSSAELLDLKICDPTMGSGAFLVQVCRWLSERLVEAWGKEMDEGKFITVDGIALDDAGGAELLPDSLDERLLIARRLVAEKCLYGVDMNPLAVELAKLSIWLVTLAKGRPFGFLDHNLRNGDSLLGLHRLTQLIRFALIPEKRQQISIFASNIKASVNEVINLRKKLREMPIRDIRDVQNMGRLDKEARIKITNIKHIADAIIGEALVSSGNAKALEISIDNLITWAVDFSQGNTDAGNKLISEARKALSIELSVGKAPRKPFHWVLEFPEVFARESEGFDALVGNPPFRGGLMITNDFGLLYTIFLKEITSGAGATTDLCGYFFRRSYDLLRQNGCLGHLASNTISQGDTRAASILPIKSQGGTFYNATKSLRWPGTANLYVSIVFIRKGQWIGPCRLDGKQIQEIGTRFSESTQIGDPRRLVSLEIPAYLGTTVYGKGFFLDKEVASKLIDEDKKNLNVIRPFLNGVDVLRQAQPGPKRFVLNFQGMSLDEVKKYSIPYRIAKKRIYPQRQKSSSKRRREKWWLYTSPAEELYRSIGNMKKVLVTCFTSKYSSFVFVSSNQLFSNAIVVIATDCEADFALLQSTLHQAWVRRYSSTLKEDQRYALSDCYETFPRPPLTKDMNRIGLLYHNKRAEIMLEKKIGLTDIYNIFHNPELNEANILKLRNLHCEMDNAVASAYHWSNIDLDHGFYETKQGIRFTISEDARQEVLQRLLKLNHERYEDEVRQGLHAKKTKRNTRAKNRLKRDPQMKLFEVTSDTNSGSKKKLKASQL